MTEHANSTATKALPSRLFHEDCIKTMSKMHQKSVDLIIADPPYGNVINKDWDQIENYLEFSKKWLEKAVRVLCPGGALLIFGSPERTFLARLIVLIEDRFKLRHVQTLAWIYTQGGGSRVSTATKYAVQHELIVWFEKPSFNESASKAAAARTFNAADGTTPYTDGERKIALAKGIGRVTNESLDRGKPPRSFLDFPRENSKSKERQHGSHPCMKPLNLVSHLVKLHSNKGDCVYVPFAGSGSEMIAAAGLGRVAVGSEIESEYVILSRKRFADHKLALTIHDGRDDDGRDDDGRDDGSDDGCDDGDNRIKRQKV